MLANAPVVFLMIEDHGKAILRLGILRAHMGRGTFGRGHELECFWPNEFLFLDCAP